MRDKIVSRNFQDSLAEFVFHTLSKKLVHLHTVKYFHGDIKADNCAFMKPVQEGVLDPDSIRFADFGNVVFCDNNGIQQGVK
jgi:serine/threonine protein kinase